MKLVRLRLLRRCDRAGTVCLFSRALVTIALVEEKHDEKKHEHSGEVEWRKESLGTSLLESGFDTDLTRHVDDRRDGGKVHLLSKKDVFSTVKERADENIKAQWFRSTNFSQLQSHARLAANLVKTSSGQSIAVNSVQMTGRWWNTTDSCTLWVHGCQMRMDCRRVCHVVTLTWRSFRMSRNGTEEQTTKGATHRVSAPL